MKDNSVYIWSIVIVLAVAAVILLLQTNPRTIPKGVTAIDNFEAEKYLGKWYEIARLDFPHEKDLEQCTAEYSQDRYGTIKVVNRGFNVKKGKWVQAEGVAKFVGGPHEGMLKVSFFRPFYSGYNIISVDGDYKYALVFGRNRKYMWILSREKAIPEHIRSRYLEQAANSGYDVSALVWTVQ